MNKKNTIAALQAAIDALHTNDQFSAIDYVTVAAAELLAGDKRLGSALIFLTEDARDCVKAGVISLDDE